jgi:hypothetical protein
MRLYRVQIGHGKITLTVHDIIVSFLPRADHKMDPKSSILAGIFLLSLIDQNNFSSGSRFERV